MTCSGVAPLILVTTLLTPLSMALAADVPKTAPPKLYPQTPLLSGGAAACRIVKSSSDNRHAAAADAIAAGLRAKYGVEFPVVVHTELCPDRVCPITEQYRRTHLILVGNVYTNRAILPFYAGFKCGADEHYPGVGGYELRTISNPWGTGRNVVVIGFSTPAGADAATAAFAAKLPALNGGSVTLPRLLEVSVGGNLRTEFDASAETASNWQFAPVQARDHVAHKFYLPALYYHWTGNVKWAQAAREVLGFFNEVYESRYPLSDYSMESWFRAWDMIEEAPVLTDTERRLTTRRMVETAYALRRYGASNGSRLGTRHTSTGSSGVWMAMKWLQRTFPDNEQIRTTTAKWEVGLRQYFTTAVSGFRDDRDSTESMNSIMVFFRWCLENGYGEYFTSGRARQAIQYSLTYHDSLGYTCGVDGYAEAVPGNLTMRYRLGHPLGALAFAEDNAGVRWFLEHFPPGQTYTAHYWPLLWEIGCYHPPAGSAVPHDPPAHLTGLSALPVSKRRYGMIEAGRARLAPGVSLTMPPQRQTVDKLCFRTGFSPNDQYLLLQGFQGCLIGTVDANTIPRYTDRGKIWLFQHSDQIGHYHRNGLFVSNGVNAEPLQASCRLDVAGRLADGFSMSSTTLVDYHGTDWQRALFWQPGEWFLVMDRATVKEPGYYAALSTWRTPGYGIWSDDQLFTTTQDDVSLHIQSSRPVRGTAQREAQDGAARPFVLRERRSGKMASGDVIDFHNLLSTTLADTPPRWKPIRLTDSAVVVRDARGNDTLLGIAGPGTTQPKGMAVDAGMYALSPARAHVVGVSKLAVGGTLLFESVEPLTGSIDLHNGRIEPGHAATDLTNTSLTWQLTEPPPPAPGKAAMETCKRVSRAVRGVIEAARAIAPGPADGQGTIPTGKGLQVAWESDQLGRKGWPIGGLKVKAKGMPGEKLYQAVDGLIPTRSVGLAWTGDQTPEFEVSWPEATTITELRLHMGMAARVSRPNLASPVTAERDVQLTWSRDGFQDDLRPQTVTADRAIYLHNPNKGYIFPHKYLVVPTGGIEASAVRVSIPRIGDESALYLTEIEVLGPERGPLETQQLLVQDLDGDGSAEVIVSSDRGLLSVLDSTGNVLWQKRFKGRTTRVVTGDLSGDGKQEIVLGTLENLVYAFSASGEALWTTSFVGLRESSNSKYCENGEVAHTVGIWEPEPGVKRVIVGHYWYLSLLDEQGVVLKSMRCAGRHRVVFAETADVDGDGLRDAFMSYDMPWQGRTAILTLKKGDDIVSSRVSVPNGVAFLAELVAGDGIKAALGTQEGFGLYDLRTNQKVWERVGGRPLSAGLIHDADGDGVEEFYIGGKDGFVSVFSLAGEPVGTHLIGESVNDITAVGSGVNSVFVVATEAALRTYDPLWRCTGVLQGNTVHVEPTGDAVIAMTADGRLRKVIVR